MASSDWTRPEVTAPGALVWFKRDLRCRDHAPLVQAQHFANAAALVVVEPAWLDSPECDPRHVAFWLDCVAQLQVALAARGMPLIVRMGAMPQVLQALRREFAFTHLFSHEETGPGWSYSRDLAVAAWCRDQGVEWTESPQTGVVRRLRSRSGWAARWAQRMQAPECTPEGGFKAPAGLLPSSLPTLRDLGLQVPAPAPASAPSQAFSQSLSQAPPAGGESAAWALLHSFLDGRGRDYRRALSSPLTAEQGCSRLSVHLAFGTLSMRCVHQASEAAIRSTADPALAHALRGFTGRLRWHCHFMQKLEDEPAIEFRNFARVFDGLRPGDTTPLEGVGREHFEAWCAGRTGYPMVDACMRQLRATGWINFRMRAMLVSFAAYHLGLHWREPGLFLARQFLDFEPGIHWSQMQMQSGTTGINTLRIYSPAKQARDHDPDGVYQRRWLPEWHTQAYPPMLVDERAAVSAAKDMLYGLRKTPAARLQADAVQHRHGSRKSGLPSTVQVRRRSKALPPEDPQGSLF